MFSLFFFFQASEEKQTRQTNQNFILLAWLFFPQKVTHELAPDLCHKWTSNEWERWKWSLIEIEASVLFGISVRQPQSRCSEFFSRRVESFPTRSPSSLSFFFFYSVGWSCADSGAIQYLYVSFCLVSTAKGVWLSCVWFATAAIQF